MAKYEFQEYPMIDASGNEADSTGTPYREIFEREEVKRLSFMVYLTDPSITDLLESDAARTNEAADTVDFRPKSSWQKYVESQKAKYGKA